MNVSNTPKIALVGFGEAAEAFATGWGAALAPQISAYDIKVGSGVDARAAARKSPESSTPWARSLVPPPRGARP